MKGVLRSTADLQSYLAERDLTLADAHCEYLQTWQHPFPLRLPRHYADLIRWTDPKDPLRLMVIPDLGEDDIKPYELADPIGDHDREAVPGLIHRYPDRALLLLTMHCQVHCRFCFRRDVVATPRPVDIQAIREYLAHHTEIKEIIFSGGDPGTYQPAFLQHLIDTLGDLDHLTTWRFHTRVPAVDPDSMSAEFQAVLAKLAQTKRVVIVTHINHVREISPATQQLWDNLSREGVMLLSQTVLLRGINATKQDLQDLFRGLITSGVKPYYLHHLDQAEGTDRFRLSIEEGKALYQSLRGHLSGITLPEYVLDLPGGWGKVPVMWLEQTAPGVYQTKSFLGNIRVYRDPAVFPDAS